VGDEVMRREGGGKEEEKDEKKKKEEEEEEEEKVGEGRGWECVHDRENQSKRMPPRKRGHFCLAQPCSKLMCGVECMVRGRDPYHSPCPQSRPMGSAR
jgi:hypothetical protein